jgi:hypothetical protein
MMETIVAQQADKRNDIGRNVLLGNRKKIAKFSKRTFTCRSTFLYGRNGLFILSLHVAGLAKKPPEAGKPRLVGEAIKVTSA